MKLTSYRRPAALPAASLASAAAPANAQDAPKALTIDNFDIHDTVHAGTVSGKTGP